MSKNPELDRNLKEAAQTSNDPEAVMPETFREVDGWLHYFDGKNWNPLCTNLIVLGETQTRQGLSYGRFLEWKDSKGRLHRWAMPIELLYGDGFEFVKRLVSEGLELIPGKKPKEMLAKYIAHSKPEKTFECTDKTGWHGDAFVLPDRVFGGSGELIFQSENPNYHKFGTKGTAEDWREKIGKFCVGNSRLVFAVSAAFACPLLPIAEIGGGGFHLRGSSSSGKTTALLVAGSVCGGSDSMSGYLQTWRATSNGLEVLAENHNHMLLCLDEIGECRPHEVGHNAYMIANGEGARRMARNTALRKSYSWQLLFLSSGERRLSDIMREAGQTARGGQEIRLCDVEADSGKNGMFENLHHFKDGREFSDYLREASRNCYGAPIRSYLAELVKLDRQKIKDQWRLHQDAFIKDAITEQNAPGEVMRVASRFALAAFAGELASFLGITGWQKGEAAEAAHKVFQVWFEGRDGKGPSDAEKALSQVRLFLEQHGQSRFQKLGSDFEEKIVNRAGFRREEHTGEYFETEYLIFPETFKTEVCKGFDSTFTARVLEEKGFLQKANDGKFSKLERYPGGRSRFYVVNSRIFSETLDTNQVFRVCQV